MKSVLISINPPNTTNIFDGIKGIEWRTKPMPTGKYYCYETKKCFGLGKVIGEYHVWRVKRYQNTSMIPEDFIALGCVPVEFLEVYSRGRPLYAHFILRPKRYAKPKELNEFKRACDGNCQDCKYAVWQTSGAAYEPYIVGCSPITRPPQSWCYVEEVQSNA